MRFISFKYLRFSCVFLLCSALSILASVVYAANRVDVQVTPKSAVLKKNIEAYIANLSQGDLKTLQSAKRAVQQQTQKASQALGYYQAQIVVRISEGDEPVLHVDVERGDPVRLRTVNIQVNGEAAELPAFAVPDDKRLKVGARLDHSAYDDEIGRASCRERV